MCCFKLLHALLFESVSSGNAESLDFALRETSSGLSNHAAVVGLRVVITLKHSKYNVQDARLFIGHNPAYIAKQPCELCILFHCNYLVYTVC